jgi:hypothetical protein
MRWSTISRWQVNTCVSEDENNETKTLRKASSLAEELTIFPAISA